MTLSDLRAMVEEIKPVHPLTPFPDYNPKRKRGNPQTVPNPKPPTTPPPKPTTPRPPDRFTPSGGGRPAKGGYGVGGGAGGAGGRGPKGVGFIPSLKRFKYPGLR